jgi:oligopeptide/dipeptide ABC transporter ATP-binding protein
LKAAEQILEVRDFSLGLVIGKKIYKVLDSISFELRKGEILALIGESGSGKTLAALSIIGLLPKNAQVLSGEILYEGKNILQMREKERRKIRRNEIATIFQDPVNYLNPLMNIGQQLAEIVPAPTKGKDVVDLCVNSLSKAGFKEPKKILRKYPHELSGGMCQRAMLAMALIRSPKIIIADEITTALDVNTQAALLAHLEELKKQYNLSLLMITHDIGLVASNCDRMVVMYAGMIFEIGSVNEVMENPIQPYTKALLSSIPIIGSQKLEAIPGTVPSILSMPDGCRFNPRCKFAVDVCRNRRPPVIKSPERVVACHVFQEVN